MIRAFLCSVVSIFLTFSLFGEELRKNSMNADQEFQQFIDEFSKSIHQSGASYEYFEYPGTGHLFTDPDSQDYNRKSSELLWQRAIQFLQDIK